MGYRWRRMYYATGLPGWIRFGYSPGWLDNSLTGLPPTAEWIISTGLMPRYREYLRTRGATPYPASKENEIQMLDEQAKAIQAQLNAARRRLEMLKKRPSTYPSQPEEELASLEEYRKSLDEEMKRVEGRIDELKKMREGKPSD